MKKIICEYINKKGDEICMIGDEDGDAFYKVNLDRFDVSDVPDILDFDTLLNDVRKEIYVSDDYADELLLTSITLMKNCFFLREFRKSISDKV